MISQINIGLEVYNSVIPRNTSTELPNCSYVWIKLIYHYLTEVEISWWFHEVSHIIVHSSGNLRPLQSPDLVHVILTLTSLTFNDENAQIFM